MNNLTDVKIRNAKAKARAYKLSDGGGLYLFVTPGGAKLWRMKYYRPPDKKEDTLAFGAYPVVTLVKARERRDAAKLLLSEGRDPKAVNKAAADEVPVAVRFDTLARGWMDVNKKWSSEHRVGVLRSFERYVFPSMGGRDVRGLATPDFLAVVKAVDDAGKHDVAARLRQRVTGVMRFAVQCGVIKANPAADLAGVLGGNKAVHRPALDCSRFHEFLGRVDSYKGRRVTQIAVLVTLLTMLRSSEVRFARWDEVDFDRAVWAVPGVRAAVGGVRFSGRGMKMGTDHVVPLSRQALALLSELRGMGDGEGFLFYGDHDNGVMSEGTVNKALRSMGYDTKKEVCGHGFRTMARAALGESGLFRDEVIELLLSHIERNSVKAAYKHTSKYSEERRKALQWWADYLDACRVKQVTPYEFASQDNS